MKTKKDYQKEFVHICLASSSAGNSFIFSFARESNPPYRLMVECGLDYKELIKKILNYGLTLNDINSVAITHEHKDHSLSAEYLASIGKPIYATESVLNRLKIGKKEKLVNNQVYPLDDYLSIMPFKVNHDVESYGFWIYDQLSDLSILFINDTKVFKFDELCCIPHNLVFIECNHIQGQLEAVMNRAMEENKPELIKYKRQAAYHLSLLGTKTMLNQLNLEKCKGIFLIHLSKDLCNEEVVRTEIKKVYKIPTYVAKREGGYL